MTKRRKGPRRRARRRPPTERQSRSVDEQQRTHKKAKLLKGTDLHSQALSQERRRQDAIQGIKNGTVNFKDLPEELREEAEIALVAISEGLFSTRPEFIPGRLWKNKEFVLSAMKNRGTLLKYASEELRDDREVVGVAVKRTGHALEFASRELRADIEIVLAAVRQDGGALEWASEELRGDREIVLAAVQDWGYALMYASEELRGDREIVLAAVQRHAQCFYYASEELQADQEMVLVVVENTAHSDDVETYVLPNISNDLKNDPLVVGSILCMGVPLQAGSEIAERLENVLLAVRALPEAFVQNVVDEESVVEFSRRWESSVWHKIRMALQLEPPGMQGTGPLFVELSGLPVELEQAKELRTLAPVIGGILSFRYRDWRDLNSYLVAPYESDDSE